MIDFHNGYRVLNEAELEELDERGPFQFSVMCWCGWHYTCLTQTEAEASARVHQELEDCDLHKEYVRMLDYPDGVKTDSG